MNEAAQLAKIARLGPAGPDEMGRELAEGPAAVEATLAEAERLAPDLATALAAARRIILVGTGASLAMSRAAEPVVRLAAARGELSAGRLGQGVVSRPVVVVREAAHAVLGAPDGEAFAPGDLVIAVSQSGHSPETLAAASVARTAGARVLAVTAGATSALANRADLLLHTPIGREEGAATKSELAALAALLALGGALPGDRHRRTTLRLALDAIVADLAGAVPAGLALRRAGRAWIVGFGTGLGLAQAMATLLHEKALLAAIATTPSEFRHGPIEAATPDDAVVLVEACSPDPARERYLARLAGELARLGTPLVVAGTMPAPTGTIPLPAATSLRPPAETGAEAEPADTGGAALLATLLRLQQAARVAAHARGTYRDGFRVLRDVVRAADDLVAS